MKNKKGFTLVELLAVIVILGIIMVIATKSVMDSVNESRKKTKYMAAKEIVEIAAAYMEVEGSDEKGCVLVVDMINKSYLESNATNPETGKNDLENSSEHKVCKGNYSAQENYEIQDEKYYEFDGYIYYIFSNTNEETSDDSIDITEETSEDIE